MYLALFCVECVRSCASSVQGVFLWDVPQCRVVRKFFGHSHVRRIACIRAGYCLFPVCVNVVGWSVFLACWRGNVLFVSLCRVVLCCVVLCSASQLGRLQRRSHSHAFRYVVVSGWQRLCVFSDKSFCFAFARMSHLLGRGSPPCVLPASYDATVRAWDCR